MSRMHLNPQEARDVDLLLQSSELVGVEYHQVSGQRLEENRQSNASEENIEVSMRMRYRIDPQSFGVMLSVRVLPYYGEVEVKISAEYATRQDVQIDPQTVKALANHEALTVLEPYAREAVQTLTARLWQNPFLLPKFEPGFVGFDLDE